MFSNTPVARPIIDFRTINRHGYNIYELINIYAKTVADYDYYSRLKKKNKKKSPLKRQSIFYNTYGYKLILLLLLFGAGGVCACVCENYN